MINIKNPLQDYSKSIVFTGAPCSGKTTAIEEIQRLSFATCEEAGRIYVTGELQKGQSIEDIISDPMKLEIEITRIALMNEANIADGRVCFLDRSSIDSVGYAKAYGISDVPYLAQISRRNYHRNVFFFERLSLLKDRIEKSDDQVDRLESNLEEAYTNLGYNLIKVPIMRVRDRVRFIFERIAHIIDVTSTLDILNCDNTGYLEYQNVKHANIDNIDEGEIERELQNAYEEGIKKCVVSAIIVNSEGKILILKANQNDHLSNRTEVLPGGKVESGEKLLDALKREIGEETGFTDFAIKKMLGSFDMKSATGIWREFVFIVVLDPSSKVVTLSPKEHSGYMWKDLENKDLFEKLKLVSPGEMIFLNYSQKLLSK